MRQAILKTDPRWLVVLAGLAALVLSIGGCVAYPAPGYYGGGYYGGGYAYAPPPVVIGRPYGGWGGGYRRW